MCNDTLLLSASENKGGTDISAAAAAAAAAVAAAAGVADLPDVALDGEASAAATQETLNPKP